MWKYLLALWTISLTAITVALVIGYQRPKQSFISYVAIERNQASAYIVDPSANIAISLDRTRSGYSGPQWSPDGQLLVYRTMHTDGTQLLISDLKTNRQHHVVVDPIHTLDLRRVRWSPTTEHFAYLVPNQENLNTATVHVRDAQGNLIHEHSVKRNNGVLYWSNNGQWLAYMYGTQSRNSDYGITFMHNDIQVNVNIDSLRWLDISSGAWSANSEHFAFEAGSRTANRRTLYIASTDTDIPLLALPREADIDVRYLWSPSGSKIAYDNLSEFISIYDLESNTVEQIDVGADTVPFPLAWLPDENGLLLNWIRMSEIPGGDQYIGLYRNSELHNLIQVRGAAYGIRWFSTNRGSQAVFEARDRGQVDIYLFDGEHVRPLTEQGVKNINPRWSSDGTQIVFESDRAGYDGTYIMDVDGTALKHISPHNTRTCCAFWRDW